MKKEDWIHFLFPRRCPVCGDIVVPEGRLICPECAAQLSPVRQPACRRCGKEITSDRQEYCRDCSHRRRSFDGGAALLNYNQAAMASMAAVKYRNRREYLDFYSAALDARFSEMVRRWGARALVPVPIHPSRRRQRGFNQAEELAVRLGRLWRIPVDKTLLVRKKKTAPQRDLDPSQRLKNLREAFSISPFRERDSIPQSVILVDDIYTTGSTAEACSRTLKEAGVCQVYVLVICITSRD